MNTLEIAEEAVRKWKACQQPRELFQLLDYVWSGETVLEIGCDAGGTLWAFQAVGARVFGVDLPNGPYGSGHELNTHGAHVIRGNSTHSAVLDQVRDVVDIPVDLLFIDGDHSYEGVKADYENYRSFVRPGGLIAFHDICAHKDYPDVRVDRLWWEIKSKNQHTTEIIYYLRPWGTGMGIGVLHV